jgi:hypothetical protein
LKSQFKKPLFLSNGKIIKTIKLPAQILNKNRSQLTQNKAAAAKPTSRSQYLVVNQLNFNFSTYNLITQLLGSNLVAVTVCLRDICVAKKTTENNQSLKFTLMVSILFPLIKNLESHKSIKSQTFNYKLAKCNHWARTRQCLLGGRCFFVWNPSEEKLAPRLSAIQSLHCICLQAGSAGSRQQCVANQYEKCLVAAAAACTQWYQKGIY